MHSPIIFLILICKIASPVFLVPPSALERSAAVCWKAKLPVAFAGCTGCELAMAGRARELPFPEKFKVLFTPGVRYFAFYGGRGGTNSWSVATWLILEACQRRLRIVCGRQYQVSIRDSSKESC